MQRSDGRLDAWARLLSGLINACRYRIERSGKINHQIILVFDTDG